MLDFDPERSPKPRGADFLAGTSPFDRMFRAREIRKLPEWRRQV
jgi:hypothetical protein